jgi:hypothetical protein
MAEFVEIGLHDQEWPTLAKAANAKFSLGLSNYDDPVQIIVAVLTSLGVAAKNTETLDVLLVKLLNRVS